MTDEEMAEAYANENWEHYEEGQNDSKALKQAYLAGLNYKNKENAELKEQISFLLSCKNCPENKGGWICAKEYENKCLAQKIECIKELEKENAELKEQCSILADGNVCSSTCSEIKKQLTKAKEIIKDYMTIVKGAHTTVCGVSEENRTINVLKLNKEAEQFLKEAQTCLSYKHYIKIPFKGESPVYSTKQAAGADIALPKDVVAKAHSIVTWIDLEVGFDIPEGFCIMLQPRSSTSRKWHVLTDTGIIDSDYKLENIHCGLVNVTDEDIKIPKGTRIVQLLILPVYHATNWKCFNNIRNSKKGSGSTGD